MANALFAGASLGLVVLPLMIFHQLQLMACATLARRYALGQSAREGAGGIRTEATGSGGCSCRLP
jgi:sodium/bile acid cotransporter 7